MLSLPFMSPERYRKSSSGKSIGEDNQKTHVFTIAGVQAPNLEVMLDAWIESLNNSGSEPLMSWETFDERMELAVRACEGERRLNEAVHGKNYYEQSEEARHTIENIAIRIIFSSDDSDRQEFRRLYADKSAFK